jgi:hypothetical protein
MALFWLSFRVGEEPFREVETLWQIETESPADVALTERSRPRIVVTSLLRKDDDYANGTERSKSEFLQGN